MAEETASSRSRAGNRLDELKRLRDEIRDDLRRATLELRDEWKEIERRLPDPTAAAEQVRGATSEMAERLVDELRRFRSRLPGGAATGTGPGAAGVALAGLMSRPVVTCLEVDSLARAVTLMFERDVGFLPVLDYDGKIVGTLTDRDAAIAAATRGQRFEEIPVETAMCRAVVTCLPTATPAQVLGLMRQRQIRRVPVAEEGRPLGVVTINDLARNADKASLTTRDIADTLAAISRPHQPGGNLDA